MKQGRKSFSGLKIRILITTIALVASFLVGGLILFLMKENPVKTYMALMQGAFGTPAAFTTSLTASVPLILSGLAVAVAFKCSAFNIGVEGQMLVGGLAAAVVGAYVKLPAGLHLIVTLLAGMLAGMFWAYIAALLKVKRNVHIIIATILLNYIAQYLVQYLILGPFNSNEGQAVTPLIQKTAELPELLKAPYVLNFGIVLAVAAIAVIYLLLNKTTLGYEMRAVGMNEKASRINGMNVERNMVTAMAISGMLAGLAGAIMVTGSMHRAIDGFSSGYGYNGIPIALMAHNNPIGIFFSAVLLGSMRNGSLLMQSMVGISKDFVDIIQGLIIIFLCSENAIQYYLKKFMIRREEKTDA